MDKIPSAVLNQFSSRATIPTLSFVFLISQCSSSLVTLDLPSPVPPVSVTSSPLRIPYSFLFRPSQGYAILSFSSLCNQSFFCDDSSMIPEGVYVLTFQHA